MDGPLATGTSGPEPAALRLARLVTFYLPQFHQIPENDEWWGPGFTEWTNTRQARPLYRGHRQPVEPGQLGYYDLSDPDIAAAQAALATEHGIEGFCYWHYWFGNGRRILEMPFQRALETGDPSIPFCLCWANESWTGVWHGAPGRMLLPQTYPGEADERAHFEFLLRAFADERYMKVDGKPILVIYRPADLPEPGRMVDLWRNLADKAGLPGLMLVGMSNNPDPEVLKHFDYTMAFGPGDYLDKHALSLPRRFARRLGASPRSALLGEALRTALGAPIRVPYAEVVDFLVNNSDWSDTAIPSILPGWDNTPRSGRRGIVFDNSTPEEFQHLLSAAIAAVQARPSDHRMVFIKAWNEWAEGNILEPTMTESTAYLEAVRRAVTTSQASR